nr:Chain B, Amyloid beta A4 protein [Homo sapiens]
ISYGNDALMP